MTEPKRPILCDFCHETHKFIVSGACYENKCKYGEHTKFACQSHLRRVVELQTWNCEHEKGNMVHVIRVRDKEGKR